MRQQPALNKRQIREFRNVVYAHYNRHGRDLPWRKSTDPYRILVSEMMLQQTQVPRVIEKYDLFLRTFPDIVSLARAPLREILAVWQGLGYNRRALALKRIAETLTAEYNGKIPSDPEALTALPGIGVATAHAICAFAFDQPTILIETNIRTVFIHHFFTERDSVKDSEIRPLVAQTVDTSNPRIWYCALMDYGAALKKEHPNPSSRSAHHSRQTQFEGSNRQIRGKILRSLVDRRRIARDRLPHEIECAPTLVTKNLEQLEREGLIVAEGRYVYIP
jgi:A/G-specific adenine glycosylase